MCQFFSKLEKDNKTIRLINCYLDFMKTKDLSNITKFENKLQHDEIMEHLKINNIDESNELEKVDWIIKNGKKYRNYLNACKFIASIIRIEENQGLNIDLEHIFNIIDEYTRNIQDFADTMFG